MSVLASAKRCQPDQVGDRGVLGQVGQPVPGRPASTAQIEQAAATTRLTVRTMAIGSHPLGRALEHQLRPITDDLTGHLIDQCGHIIPQHRPDALLALLESFLAH